MKTLVQTIIFAVLLFVSLVKAGQILEPPPGFFTAPSSTFVFAFEVTTSPPPGTEFVEVGLESLLSTSQGPVIYDLGTYDKTTGYKVKITLPSYVPIGKYNLTVVEHISSSGVVGPVVKTWKIHRQAFIVDQIITLDDPVVTATL